jgi:hypothetical protein
MRRIDQERDSRSESLTIARRDLLRSAVMGGILGAVAASAARAEVWEEGEEQCRAHVKERPLGDNIDDAMLADFMQVSSTLTGIPLNSEADRRLGRQYVERYARVDELADLLPKLIAAHKKTREQPNLDAAELVMNNGEVRPAAEQLIYLWYLSAFYLPLLDSTNAAKRLWVYGTTEQYERALLWKVVGAHAPMAQPTPKFSKGGKLPGWASAPPQG